MPCDRAEGSVVGRSFGGVRWCGVDTGAMRIDFDPDALDRTTFYRLLTATVVPRPIAWVSTTSAAGTDNLAPATFGGKRCR